MQRPDNMVHTVATRGRDVEAARPPLVRLTGYIRCGMGLRVVLIEAWLSSLPRITLGRPRRAPRRVDTTCFDVSKVRGGADSATVLLIIS